MSFLQQINFQQFLSAFLILFAAIDAVGSIPVILNSKEKGRIINPKTGTLYATIMMFSFFYIGEAFLSLFGLDISTFAIAGSIVIFFFGLEMMLDIEIFKSGGPKSSKDATFIPIVFPLLTGAGVLTTLLTIRAQYHDINILLAIAANIVIISLILFFVEKIAAFLGQGVIYMLQKFFGILLLAIAFKIFITNVTIVVERIN
ncbi:MAG: MarC family protein [Alphaproteobacteria bacterium]|nr:MarC family protein [Alphaproteobacteria bacterium]MBQ3117079.1 MarC family protein [Alphaproteobacteria bacterium]MBQ6854912.1 MarC family protein [Alphaproteobacteria bacterium]MBQ8557684.1 MarC family protein [Alphaproteobacteria bacterium]MBR4931768.1 MarC family protein [Alphaproteobacteria bacterium]